MTSDILFRVGNVTHRPALSSLFPVAASGKDTQVGVLGEDNRVASCGERAQRSQGRGIEVFRWKPNQVLGEKSAARRPHTQFFALSREAAALLQGGACEAGVSEDLALEALARATTTAAF